MPISHRNTWIDALKGLACLAIVGHHLSAYGPLPATVWPAAPALFAWFYDYARMAVQVFLVLGGYLAAASLAPEGAARFGRWAEAVGRRFARLAVPYAAALLVAVVVSALVRPWLDDPAVPDAPSIGQVLANALMLQDVLDHPALSAGAWYVAIDLQLFALTALVLAGARQVARGNARLAALLGQGLVLALCAASLLFFNRDAELDDWALYFFGAYGLGMACFWATHSARPFRWLLALGLLAGVALWVEFRPRVVLAVGTAAWLAWLALWPGLGRGVGWAERCAVPLVWVGQRSYSIFLIHFAVCLLVNAVVATLWPGAVAAHALGLVAALALSVVAGWALYERVERPGASARQALRWQVRLLGAGALAALWPGV